MKRIASILLIVTSLMTLAGGQRITKSARELQAGDLTYRKAIPYATQHLKQLMGVSMEASKWTGELRQDPYGRRTWEFHGGTNQYWVRVDARDGKLIAFHNSGRRFEQYKGRGRTGKTRFKTDGEWQAYLRREATRLGVPANTTMDRYKWKRDGQVKDANSAGYVACFFMRGQTEIAMLNCDPQDGAIIHFIWGRHAR